MTFADYLLVAAILGVFRAVDRALRRGKLFTRLPAVPARHTMVVAGLSLFAVLLAQGASWSTLSRELPLRALIFALTVMLTWKSVTDDIDVATGEAWWLERALLLLTAGGVWLTPGMLLPWLYLIVHPFKAWKHHGKLSLRLLFFFVSWLLLVVPAGAMMRALELDIDWHPESVFLIVALMVHASHYVVPGLGKVRLGRQGYSWWRHNRIHYLCATAYSWGWARFLGWRRMRSMIRVLEPWHRLLQATTLIVEIGALAILLHPTVLMADLAGLVLMHAMIFLCTGILFWEWAATNLMLIAVVAGARASAIDIVFSLETWALSMLLIMVFPWRRRLWSPAVLAWWDTPLAQRVDWQVLGSSGKIYGLYNDFMCPHERLFGRVHGYFMVDEAICTYHLGEVWDFELREQIITAQGDRRRIEAIKAKYGKSLRDRSEEAEHIRYMKRFFNNLNGGARKYVLPRGLRWLKAPGGQFYYWGDHPAYRRQEKVERLIVSYREEIFDGDNLVRLQDRVVCEIPIVESPIVESPIGENPIGENPARDIQVDWPKTVVAPRHHAPIAGPTSHPSSHPATRPIAVNE